MDFSYQKVECTSEKLKTMLKDNVLAMVVPNVNHPLVAILAYQNDMPVGVLISFERMGGDLRIANIFVRNDYQRRGIGTKMLKDIEEIAKQKTILTLSLIVADTNDGAKKLYKNTGFVPNLKELDKAWFKRII